MTLVFWYFGKKYLFGVVYDSFILQRVIYVGRVIYFKKDIRNLVYVLLYMLFELFHCLMRVLLVQVSKIICNHVSF